MFRFALHCAEESGDWHRRAKVLSCVRMDTAIREMLWKLNRTTPRH